MIETKEPSPRVYELVDKDGQCYEYYYDAKEHCFRTRHKSDPDKVIEVITAEQLETIKGNTTVSL